MASDDSHRLYPSLNEPAGKADYYFRGTSEGFEGNIGNRTVGRTPVTSNPSRAIQLRQAVDQHVAAHEIATGRKLTPAEQQDLLLQVSSSLILDAPSGFAHGLTRYEGAKDQQDGEEIKVADFRQPILQRPSSTGADRLMETEQPVAPAGNESLQTKVPVPNDQQVQTIDGIAEPPGDTGDDSDAARKRDILQGAGGKFIVADNPRANGEWPLIEDPEASPVLKLKGEIDAVSKETGVDANLIRAIMYMETTHGGYDWILDKIGRNRSILPMNVNVSYWGDHFGTREQLHDPYLNILAGAKMLKAIESNVPAGTSIAKIATLYNNHRARSVSDYGARVAHIYDNRIWEHPPASRRPRAPKLSR